MADARTLEIVLKATDQASKVLDTGASKIEGAVGRIIKKLDNLTASQKAGLLGGLLEAGGLMAMHAWDKAADSAIEYGGQVITIQRLTGESAETASEFAAILDRYGISAESAGKMLKTLALQIVATNTASEASSTYLGKMGIATEDAAGKTRDSISVLADVAEYYATADDNTEALAYTSKVLGRNFQDLLPILAGGRDKMLELTESARENGLVLGQDAIDAIGKYKSAAKDAAEAQKGMTIQFGLAVVPIKTFIMDGVAKVFEWFNKLSPETKKIITYIGLGATALALIAGPILIIIGALPMLAAGFGLVSAAAAPLLVPILAIVAGIAAVVAIVVVCIKYHEQIKKALIAAWDAIKGALTAAWDAIKGAFATAWNAIKDFFGRFWPVFLGIATGGLGLLVGAIVKWHESIKAAVVAAWNAIRGAFEAAWNGIKSAFNAVGQFFVAAWEWLKGIFVGAAQAIAGFVTQHFGFLYDGVRRIFDGIKAFFVAFWEVLKIIFLAPVLFIYDLVTGNFTKLNQDVSAVWEKLKAATGAMLDALKQIFQAALDLIVGLVNVAKDAIVATWNGLKAATTAIWHGIVATIDAAKDAMVATWNAVKAAAEAIWNGIKAGLSAAWTAIKDALTTAAHAMVDGAKAIWNGLIDFVKAMPGRIVDGLGALGSLLLSAGKAVIQGLWDGMKAIWSGTVSFITGLPSNIKSAIGNLGSLLYNVGADIVSGLWNGLKSLWTRVTDWIRDKINAIPGAIRHLLGISSPSKVMAEIGRHTVSGMLQGLQAGAPDVLRAAGSLANSMTQGFGANLGGSFTVAGAGAGGTTIHIGSITLDGSKMSEASYRGLIDSIQTAARMGG